jgi:YVTN family beta-propeller protein
MRAFRSRCKVYFTQYPEFDKSKLAARFPLVHAFGANMRVNLICVVILGILSLLLILTSFGQAGSSGVLQSPNGGPDTSGFAHPVKERAIDPVAYIPSPKPMACTRFCVIANLTVGNGPTGLAYDSSTDRLYVANFNSNNVSIINTKTNTVAGSVSVGSLPWGARYDRVNNEIYVTNNNLTGQSTVSVISGSTVLATVPVGDGSQEMTQTPNGYVYVSNTLTSNVSVINGSTNTVQATISGGGLDWPVGEAYDSQNGNIYVANYASGTSGTVTVIHGTSANGTIDHLGSDPQGVTYDPVNGYVYVTNEYSGNVSVINATSDSVIASVATGGLPWGITCDLKTGEVFVANVNTASQNQVTVISGTTVSSTFTLATSGLGKSGAEGDNVLYNVANGDLYATVYSTGRLYVVSTVQPQYTIHVDQRGLPTGKEWWLNLTTGQAFHTVKSTISFSEPNGTYKFTVATTDKEYRARAGSLSVNGGNVTKRVAFSLVTFKVTFTETGLPSGTKWWVNLTNGQDFGSNRTSIGFVEGNGTYSFSLASANGTYSASGGTFTVAGTSVTIKVHFT